ncbi:CDP-alcohol phosphatidyltransferase family protein [Allosphingosinicella sp.]|jgi:phosphatidylcholine synthase|uniref:CDP-alcohol phosphatidyltransferase family protein n=1 Tax=Allosphingosinicella sp. TaxID=2823234 RepID=UPI002F24653A
MEAPPAQDAPRFAVGLAWLVHALTASGAVFGLLALAATERGDIRAALLWLFAALVIDGVDGWLARRARVKLLAPRIDGAALDLIVDYLNYVFVPTLIIWRAGLVPEPLALPLAALIQLSSLYHFARTDMKGTDNYFMGFPALWNMVAFYLVVAQLGRSAGAAIVLLLVAMTFAPVHFVHPFRVTDYGLWLPLIAVLWALATLALLWPDWSPAARDGLLGLSLGAAAILLAMGLLRSLRGTRPAAVADGG